MLGVISPEFALRIVRNASFWPMKESGSQFTSGVMRRSVPP